VDRRGSSFLAAAALLLVAAPARAAEPAAPSSMSMSASLIHDAHQKHLAQSREWQVLLHYRPTSFGGWKSQADGLGFFFAGKAGKTDPDAELAATIAALLRPSVRDPTNPATMHPQCLFPARYAWIKQQLRSAAFVDQPCPLLDTWRTGISAEAVTLVYATAYLNSPASMYGHTFLRLSRATGEGNPLLDYAVNFAADADTTNGLVYAIAGLTGGFQGHFYVVPTTSRSRNTPTWRAGTCGSTSWRSRASRSSGWCCTHGRRARPTSTTSSPTRTARISC
jgi:hypothetical protein